MPEALTYDGRSKLLRNGLAARSLSLTVCQLS